MDPNSDDIVALAQAEARELLDRLISAGCGVDLATACARVLLRLVTEPSTLKRCIEEPPEDDELAVGLTGSLFDDDPDRVLLHRGVLQPLWNQFAAALCSVVASDQALSCVASSEQQGYITLVLRGVELGPEMLLRNFATVPLRALNLMNNNMGRNIKFAVDILRTNGMIELLGIFENLIGSEEEALSLVGAVSQHPRLVAIVLENCGIGQSDAVMAAIVPALDDLREVTLNGNNIGSNGARLIADYLASNPAVAGLSLDDNFLDDEDAAGFAVSLKTNTNLRQLSLAENLITRGGYNALLFALCDLRSFYILFDCNHTCQIVGAGEDHPISKLNFFDDPLINMKVKLVTVLAPLQEPRTPLYREPSSCFCCEEVAADAYIFA